MGGLQGRRVLRSLTGTLVPCRGSMGFRSEEEDEASRGKNLGLVKTRRFCDFILQIDSAQPRAEPWRRGGRWFKVDKNINDWPDGKLSGQRTTGIERGGVSSLSRKKVLS